MLLVISCNACQNEPKQRRDRNEKKIIKNYESTIGKTTTAQNYHNQIDNLDKEFNNRPRNATEIVIIEE